ncbi:YqhV family protein [Cohnella zeiphila]
MDKHVFSMALLRIVSGSLELTAALVMLKLNEVQKALAVNSMLALVGPIVLLTTTAIGLVGLSDKLSPMRLILVTVGVSCLLIGILKK